ncbi:hypothetical protein NQ315_009669 [Exocentrus adspersus]|uniref:Uncharacterized protein n=1 Tax=Exocentrus adspersus TaxID=1586481 RepID=A0AAV8WGY1_9CUCU|nr:hypothetical protein NQ315_009669 [Exocentrus adspersus]
MPTVILLDVSLSMTRPVQLSDGTESIRKQLAEIGINAFLDHLSVHSKLEFISLKEHLSKKDKQQPSRNQL